jgi:hypothetical protein
MIKHLNSFPCSLKMNGVVEVANKNINKIMNKMVVTYYAFHAYQTTIRIST